MKKLRIGIIGCGAIGSSLAKTVALDMPRAMLSGLYDINPLKADNLSEAIIRSKRLALKSRERLILGSDLVIECASSLYSFRIAQNALRKGRDIMIMSVGGLVGHYPALLALAQKYNCRVYIPSGAIAGIDALKAAALGKIKKVTLTTRKNPLSFKGVKFVEDQRINLAALKKDKLLFCGSASNAVRRFPQNINVAAVLSLAGIGADKTIVKIIASPSIKKNVHEIEIESAAGNIFSRSENILHPKNPKTSFLAVLSAMATLKQILTPVKIGT